MKSLTPAPKATHKFRREIAGLRGIAILLVLLNHLSFFNFRNGYAGVDVFFVISGYLIIGGIIESYKESILKYGAKAKFSISSFYIRRFLRLAPAATVVTLTTLALSLTLFNSVRAKIVVEDALWSSIFLANYHFTQTGVDYFSRQLIPSPFQHFWSLSIEEQFYFFLPFFFISLISLHGFKLGKFTLHWYSRVVIGMSAVFFVSFAFAIRLFQDDLTSFYFSTAARAWELLLGGLTYVVHSKFSFSQTAKSKIVRFLILVILFLWTIFGGGGSNLSFSVILAACLFCSLSLLFYSDSGFPGKFLYCNQILVFLGGISYSLYLWHWPIKIFTQNWVDNRLLADVILVTLSISIATLSRKFVEEPFLALRVKPDFDVRDLPVIRRIPTMNFWEIKVKAWVALLAIFSMPGLALFNSSTPPSPTMLISSEKFLSTSANGTLSELQGGETTTGISSSDQLIEDADYEQALKNWAVNISEGLSIDKVPPTLDPSFKNILSEKGPLWNECLFQYKNLSCRFGNESSRKVVLFGDSFAFSLLPAVREALKDSSVEIVVLTLHECGVSDVTPWLLGKEYTECVENREWAINRIGILRPELIIMAENATFPIASAGSNATDQQRDKLWSRGLSSTFAKLSSMQAKKIYVGQWPIRDRSITDCVDAKMTIDNSCLGRTQNSVKFRFTAKSIATANGFNYVDSTRWLCDRLLCPAIIANSPVVFDNAHFGVSFSKKLGPIFRLYLESINVKTN